ncbi:MAG: ECF transporter S component [Clostridia bacterium]|nr:ECF transporter S component [Clostridia bacterium]
MNSKKKDIRYMVSVALMAAIVVLLANTPLGMIQLPIIKATTVHIPVIIGAVLLGPLAGAILGATFGICSMLSNTFAPTLLSFAFSPFLSTTGFVGAVKAVWIAVGCRILIGVAAGWLWIFFTKVKLPQPVSLAITGFVGSMVNTICVMGSIYFLFAQQYAEVKEVAVSAVFGLVMTTVTASGIPEAIAAAILVSAIGFALIKAMPRLMPEKDKKNKNKLTPAKEA